MLNFKTSILFAASITLMAGCGGPQQGSVPNNPPVIEPSATAFSLKYGSLSPDFISAIIWPQTWTEAQYETNVRAIDEDGKALIAHIIDTQKKPNMQINTLWRQFRADACVEKYAVDGTSNNPLDYQETSAVSLVNTPDSAACLANVQARTDLNTQLGAAITAESDPAHPGPLSVLQGDIAAKLGSGVDLFSGIDTSASGIKFTLDASGTLQPRIFFGNFQNTGKTVSNATKNDALLITDVSVSASGDQLSFTLPDLPTEVVVTTKTSSDGTTVTTTLENGKIMTVIASPDAAAPDDSKTTVTTTIQDGKTTTTVKDGTTVVASKTNTIVKTHYVITLVRVQPLYSFSEYQDDGSSLATEEAVFKGDLAVVDSAGHTTATGSVQIIGKFVGAQPTSPPLPIPVATPVPTPTPVPVPTPSAAPAPSAS